MNHQEAKDFEARCWKRRIIGFGLLALGGVFFLGINPSGSGAMNAAYMAGQYSVPVAVFAAGLYYVLTKPPMKA